MSRRTATTASQRQTNPPAGPEEGPAMTTTNANARAQRSARLSWTILLVLALAAAAPGCDEGADAPRDGVVGARIAIGVAPLRLAGIKDVHYTVTVTTPGVEGGDPQTVWTKEITSSVYGDGAGAISYVGPCDASFAKNRVTVVIDWLVDEDDVTIPGDSLPNPTPVWRDADCKANADTSVSFDITLARPANQGFFDVAVNFEDIFCSAKLDCLNDRNEPIELLHHDGVRDTTIVIGLACTAGTGQPTVLHASALKLDCGDAGTVWLSPNAAGGQTGARGPLVFEYASYQGRESYTDANVCYWNHAVGLDLDVAALAGATCTLSGRATASMGAWEEGLSPSEHWYPFVSWSATVIEEGSLACGRHGLDLSAEVTTQYTAGEARFPFEMGCKRGEAPEPRLVGRACEGVDDVVVGFADEGVVVSLDGVPSQPYQLPGAVIGAPGTCCESGGGVVE
ncbi:MAG: hypothetical protein H6745_29965 [Deltaproteobacteria bacterium]|nr:hypothetical protein [Deltaproteobacteria bacterium]